MNQEDAGPLRCPAETWDFPGTSSPYRPHVRAHSFPVRSGAGPGGGSPGKPAAGLPWVWPRTGWGEDPCT